MNTTAACERASAMSDAAAGSSNDGAEHGGSSGAVASAGRLDNAASTALFAKIEEMKKRGLELLKTTSETVHIISTPFDSEQGRSLARKVAQACEPSSGTREAFCYNPNEDCPQTLDVSWLATWMAICNNTARTGGSVFVIFRSDGKGKYGCEAKGPWSLDGQAQEGEINHALSRGCSIHWLDSTNPDAAMHELKRGADRRRSNQAHIRSRLTLESSDTEESDLKAYKAGQTLMLHPKEHMVVDRFHDECVLSYVVAIEESVSQVTMADRELFELRNEIKVLESEIRACDQELIDNGIEDNMSAVAREVALGKDHKLKNLDVERIRKKAKLQENKLRREKLDNYKKNGSAPQDSEDKDVLTTYTDAPGSEETGTGLFSEIGEWLTLDRKKAAEKELKLKLQAIMAQTLKTTVADAVQKSSEAKKLEAKLSNVPVKPYWLVTCFDGFFASQDRKIALKKLRESEEEAEIARVLRMGISHTQIEVRVDKVSRQVRIVVPFDFSFKDPRTPKQKAKDLQLAVKVARRARFQLSGFLDENGEHTERTPVPIYMVGNTEERKIIIEFMGARMKIIWAKSVEINQSSKRKELVKEREDYVNGIKLRKQEAAEMANLENALKNKAEEVADLEKKMNNAAAELVKAKADLEISTAWLVRAESDRSRQRVSDDRQVEEARTAKSEALGNLKIHKSGLERSQRKFEREKELEQKMLKQLSGATVFVASASLDSGPNIPIYRNDLVPDALTGIDKVPRNHRSLASTKAAYLKQLNRLAPRADDDDDKGGDLWRPQARQSV